MDGEHEREEQASELGRYKCPKCGSPDIRRSKSEGFVAFAFQLLGRWPFRCRSCRVRFYRHADPPIER